MFCPEDLEEHFHHLYHPSQQLQRSEHAKPLPEQGEPVESPYYDEPKLVLNPDKREVAIARQLKPDFGRPTSAVQKFAAVQEVGMATIVFMTGHTRGLLLHSCLHHPSIT